MIEGSSPSVVILLSPHNRTQKRNLRMQITINAIDLQLIKNEYGSRIDSFFSQFGIATIARSSSIKKARRYSALTILLNIFVLPFIEKISIEASSPILKSIPEKMPSMSLFAQAIYVGEDSCSNWPLAFMNS